VRGIRACGRAVVAAVFCVALVTGGSTVAAQDAVEFSGGADICVLTDLSASAVDNRGDVENLLGELSAIARAEQARIGLVGFADYSQAPFGFDSDVPFLKLAPIGSVDAFDLAVTAMPFGRGGDPSEAQLDAIGTAVRSDGAGCGWRTTSAARFLVVFTDSRCHVPDGTHQLSTSAAAAALRASGVQFVGVADGSEAAACLGAVASEAGGRTFVLGPAVDSAVSYLGGEVRAAGPVAVITQVLDQTVLPPGQVRDQGASGTPVKEPQILVPVKPVSAIELSSKAASLQVEAKKPILAVTGAESMRTVVLAGLIIGMGLVAVGFSRRLESGGLASTAVLGPRTAASAGLRLVPSRGQLAIGVLVAIAVTATVLVVDQDEADGQAAAATAASIEQYAPGGARALAAAGRYYDKTSSCFEGLWRVHDQDLTPGVYYADCDIDMANSSGTITVVSTGTITVAGDSLNLAPFQDDTLFVAQTIDDKTMNSILMGTLVVEPQQPTLAITAPQPGEVIDLGESGTGSGTFIIEGTVSAGAEVVVSYGATRVAAAVDASTDPNRWTAEVGGIQDGSSRYSVTATSTNGLSRTADVEVIITMPAPTDTLFNRDFVPSAMDVETLPGTNLDTGELRLAAADAAAEVQIGAVIVTPQDVRPWLGPFRRVTGVVAAADGSRQVSTEPAYLDDVYNQLDISIVTKLSPGGSFASTQGSLVTSTEGAGDLARQFGSEFVNALCSLIGELEEGEDPDSLLDRCRQDCFGVGLADNPFAVDTCDVQQLIDGVGDLLQRFDPVSCDYGPVAAGLGPVRLATGVEAVCNTGINFDPWEFSETVSLAPVIDAASVIVPRINPNEIEVPDLQDVAGTLTFDGELDAELLLEIRVGAGLGLGEGILDGLELVGTEISVTIDMVIEGEASLSGSAAYELDRTTFEVLEIPIPKLSRKVPVRLKGLETELGVAVEFEPGVVFQATGFIEGQVNYGVGGAVSATAVWSPPNALVPNPDVFRPVRLEEFTVVQDPEAAGFELAAKGHLAWETGAVARLEADLDAGVSLDIGMAVGLEERSKISATLGEEQTTDLSSELCVVGALDAEAPVVGNALELIENYLELADNVIAATAALNDLRQLKQQDVTDVARVSALVASLEELSLDSLRLVEENLDLLQNSETLGDTDVSLEVPGLCVQGRAASFGGAVAGQGDNGPGEPGDPSGPVEVDVRRTCVSLVDRAFDTVDREFGRAARSQYLGFDSPVFEGDHLCDVLPIYSPGTDLGAATRVREAALDLYPPWVVQARIPARSRSWLSAGTGQIWEFGPEGEVYPMDPAWPNTFSEGCGGPVPADGAQCDEFPNATMITGGNPASFVNVVEVPTTVYVTADDNRSEGTAWQAFFESCRQGIPITRARATSLDPSMGETLPEERFLVVPVGRLGKATTQSNCDGDANPLEVVSSQPIPCRGLDVYTEAALVSGFKPGETVRAEWRFSGSPELNQDAADDDGRYRVEFACIEASNEPIVILLTGEESGRSIAVTINLAADRLVVLMGDSYTAGNGSEGADPDDCYRGPLTWGAQWAELKSTSNRQVSTLNLACSGAVVADLDAQIQQLPADAAVVLLTIGGNDLGFSAIVRDCFVLDILPGTCSRAVDSGTDGLTEVEAATADALVAIREAAPDARVVLVGYPYLIDELAPPYTTSPAVGAEFDAQAAIRELQRQGELAQLRAVETAIFELGPRFASFVSIKPLFDNHAPVPGLRGRFAGAWSRGVLDTTDKNLWYHFDKDGHKELARYLNTCLRVNGVSTCAPGW